MYSNTKYRNRLLAIPIFIMVASFNSGCTWDQVPLFGNGGDGIKDSVCYQNEIEPIISSNCAKSGCHDANTQANGIDLSNYWGVLEIVKPGSPDKSKLVSAIKGGGEDLMPPNPYNPLTTEQIALIETWIQQGAGYNIDCGTNIPCDTTNVTYSLTIRPIIDNHCIGCHATTGTGGGILLNTWGQVADQALNGNLLCSVYQEGGCVPMPQGASKLSDCDLTKITIWVNAGAPNN